MIQTIISDCNFGVAPRDDGGKNISLYHAKSDMLYVILWQPGPLGELLEMLNMSNEELTALNERREQDRRNGQNE